MRMRSLKDIVLNLLAGILILAADPRQYVEIDAGRWVTSRVASAPRVEWKGDIEWDHEKILVSIRSRPRRSGWAISGTYGFT